jgi:hypothetical protein
MKRPIAKPTKQLSRKQRKATPKAYTLYLRDVWRKSMRNFWVNDSIKEHESPGAP